MPADISMERVHKNDHSLQCYISSGAFRAMHGLNEYTVVKSPRPREWLIQMWKIETKLSHI